MLKAIIIGDVGSRDFFHLGDEAMTQVAIEQLRARSFEEITLVAAEPDFASSWYGVRSVPRIGFSKHWSKEKMEEKLKNIEQVAEIERDSEGSIFQAMAEADLALIAGGGNLNSTYYQHVYERAAFARIAKFFRVPLYVTSQTIGPDLDRREEQLVREIFDISIIFGVRETYSATLLKEIGYPQEKIAVGVDDAYLIELPEQPAEGYGISEERYIVGSFTSDPGKSGLSREEYYRTIAEILDQTATYFNSEVYLIPHIGSLDRNKCLYDNKSDRQIVSLTRSGRVHAIPIPTPADYLAILSKASFSISTRYHPVVFAPVTQTIPIGIALSQYSVVRMDGALYNVGLQGLTLTLSNVNLIRDILIELSADQNLLAHVSDTVQRIKRHLEEWWDAIATLQINFPNFNEVIQYEFGAEWNKLNKKVIPLDLELGEMKNQNFEIKRQLKETIHASEKTVLQYKKTIAELEDELSISQQEIKTVQQQISIMHNRKIVRLVDKLADLFFPNRRTGKRTNI